MPAASEPETAARRSGITGWIQPRHKAAILAGFAYAVLILIMWGAFNVYSGLPYETAFPYTSETRSAWDGFFYHADPMRIHTSTFYHLSYLISEVAGIRGSYVPYQVVYAVLWWARGFLVFLIVRKFLPRSTTLCYAAGALVLVHSSDGALQWVGQLNQFGFIFWMLLAFYCLVRAYDSEDRDVTVLWGVAACFFEYMSLWSYESQLILVLIFPLVLLLRHRRWPRLAAVAAAWYFAPALYLAITVRRYMGSAGATYQESVLRKDWHVGSLLSDWMFNIGASLEFWDWVRGGWKAPESTAIGLSIGAALVFVLFGFTVVYFARRKGGLTLARRPGTWAGLLAIGVVLLVLSFPVYLVLDTARGLWRTQFLSGIGAGLVLTALVGSAASVFRQPRVRVAIFLLLGAIIIGFGSTSAIQKGALHRWIWERHRAVINEILHVAPSVKPNTVIVLTNVPKDDDPFGHNMWLDLSLRLAYPGIPVAGIYYYRDGTPSLGNNLKVQGGSWKWDTTGFPTVVRSTSLANTVVVDYEGSRGGEPSTYLPPFLCQMPCDAKLYRARGAITGVVSPIAKLRYRP